MESTQQLIELGAQLANRIKNIKYVDEICSKVVMNIAAYLSMIKKDAKIFYPGHTEFDILKTLIKYSDKDLEEILNREKLI